jgi:hypothetical protein
MTWWALLKQFTNITGMEHLLAVEEKFSSNLDDYLHGEEDETFESVLNELDNSLGQYATVEQPIDLGFMHYHQSLASKAQVFSKIEILIGMIREMATVGSVIINDHDIELSREIDNINYSFNVRLNSILHKPHGCIYLYANLSDGFPRICFKAPEGTSELLGNFMISGMSALEALMDTLDNFQFFLEDVELWRRWGANGENLEDGKLTENMPDYDKIKGRISISATKGIPSRFLIDKVGNQYFRDGIFKFHSTYWSPVEGSREYYTRNVTPR